MTAPETAPRTGWTRAAPVVSAVAVVALVVGVSVALSGRGPSEPPVLRLAGGGTTDAASAEGPGVGGLRTSGPLPAGPGTAPVQELPSGAAPEVRVRALAVALGVTAAPLRNDDGWVAGLLRVRDDAGHSWSYGAATACDGGPDTPVSSSSDGVVTCGGTVEPGSGGGATGSGGSAAVEVQPAPSPADATTTRGRVVPPTLSCAQGYEPAPPPEDYSRCDPKGAAGECAAIEPSPVPAGVTRVPCTAPPPPVQSPPTCRRVLVPLPAGPPPATRCTPSPGEDEVAAAVAAVRTALGLDDAEATTSTFPGGATVVLDPRVAELRTRGAATVITLQGIGADLRVTSASGLLSAVDAAVKRGAVYPLVSADEALARIAMPAIGAPCQPSGCPEPPTVTAAEVGLLLTPLQDDRAVLAPAWLFTVTGGFSDATSVLPVLALPDELVDRGGDDTPDPGTTDPGSGTEPGDPGSGSGSGSTEPVPPDEPGSTPVAPPATASPGPPVTDPAPPATGRPTPAPGGEGQEPFSFDGALRDDRPTSLTVRYGDSSSCPHTSVTSSVKESADRVVVLLQADAMDPNQACTADYRAMFVTLSLAAPLGDRVVIDGSSGREVAVGTCPSPTEMCP